MRLVEQPHPGGEGGIWPPLKVPAPSSELGSEAKRKVSKSVVPFGLGKLT